LGGFGHQSGLANGMDSAASLLPADALEVVVATPDGGPVGIESVLVVGPLAFLGFAGEADGGGVEHRHRASALERTAAPVALRFLEKIITHGCLLSFDFHGVGNDRQQVLVVVFAHSAV